MIQASEAKKLAGLTVAEKVEKLSFPIKKLALERKRQLRTGYDYVEDDDLWISGGYSNTQEWKDAKKILEGLGYNVRFYYSDGSQFVDMYTLIEW